MNESLFYATRQEIKVVGIILLVIFLFFTINVQKAQILYRDVQRKNDLKHIASTLEDYLQDNSAYPPSKDGKIVACGDTLSPQPCNWGSDPLGQYTDRLSEDPLEYMDTYHYVYLSDTRNFQLLAHLETKSDDEYNKKVEQRNIACGKGICNFALANGKTPVDVDLDTIPHEN